MVIVAYFCVTIISMKRLSLFFCALFFSIITAFAAVPDWSFIDYTYKVYGADGELYDEAEVSPRDMIAICLSFSVVKPEDEEWKKSFEKYDSLLKKARKAQKKCKTQKEFAEKILDILYEDCLLVYGRHKDFMNNTLLKGDYNCVSSSVLYQALCLECGIDARAQIVPGHMLVTVYVDGEKIDVETTNSSGFEPGTQKIRVINGKTVKSVCHKKDYAVRNEVSRMAAATRIAVNNASLMNEDNELTLAIPMTYSAVKLIEDKNDYDFTRADFDRLIGNYAIIVANESTSEDACYFLEAAIDRYGKTAALQKEFADHVYNAMVEHYNAGDFDTAHNKLFMWKRYLTDKDYREDVGLLQQGHVKSIHNKMVDLWNKNKTDEAVKAIEDGLKLYPSSKLLNDDLKRLKK